MNDHLFGKELFILFTVRVFRERLSVCVCLSFLFGLWGGMWDLVVLVPDRCLFTFHDFLAFSKARQRRELTRKRSTV